VIGVLIVLKRHWPARSGRHPRAAARWSIIGADRRLA